jgi:hypothetical protein
MENEKISAGEVADWGDGVLRGRCDAKRHRKVRRKRVAFALERSRDLPDLHSQAATPQLATIKKRNRPRTELQTWGGSEHCKSIVRQTGHRECLAPRIGRRRRIASPGGTLPANSARLIRSQENACLAGRPFGS